MLQNPEGCRYTMAASPGMCSRFTLLSFMKQPPKVLLRSLQSNMKSLGNKTLPCPSFSVLLCPALSLLLPSSSLWRLCGPGEVGCDHLLLAQLSHAVPHRLQNRPEPTVHRQQMGLCEDCLQRIGLQGFPHHVAKAILGPGQQLQPQQRRSLDPGDEQ